MRNCVNLVSTTILLCTILFLGNTITLEAVSPSVVALQPPNTLVLETRSLGSYILTDWSKEDTNPLLGSFAHFGEIYYRANTTTDDLGRYRARLSPVDPNETSWEIYFDVVTPGNAHTVLMLAPILCALCVYSSC